MACLALDSRYSLLPRQLRPACYLRRATVPDRRQKQAPAVPDQAPGPDQGRAAPEDGNPHAEIKLSTELPV